MPKAQPPKDDEEWVKLVEQITAGADDRTAVILGATLVDVTLEAMLLSWLRPDTSVEEFGLFSFREDESCVCSGSFGPGRED